MTSPLKLAGLLLLILAAALAAGAELLAVWLGPALRTAVYVGGVAGLAVTLMGVPFAARLSRLGADTGAAFWRWWAAGFLSRLVVLVAAAFGLAAFAGEQAAAAILTLGAVYLVGMFAETGWLATRLFAEAKN
jgi:hypothetical protein